MHGVYIFRIFVLATFCPALRAAGTCLAAWMLAALSCVVFLAILLAARNLLLPGFALVPVACGLACVGCWCDRNSRDAWDFAFWSLHAEVRQ